MDRADDRLEHGAEDRLDAGDQEQIAAAAELYAPLRRAAGFARLSGGTMVFFGAMTLMFLALGFDLVGLVLGTALCVCGGLELGAARRIKSGDPTAFTRLGWNQWAVFLIISGYAALQVWGPGAGEAYAEVKAMDRNIGELAEQLSATVYTSVILVSFLFQGLMARMYFRRRALAERYSTEVPGWIRRVVEGLSV